MDARDYSLDRVGWQEWFDANGRAELNLLLFALWDPIGVNGSAIFGGEYEHYVPDVLGYVEADDPAGLSRYLRDVERDAMGLAAPTATDAIAGSIIAGAWASAWIFFGRPLPGDR